MKRAVLIAVLAFLVPLAPVLAWDGEGTVLDLDSLPKDWILAGYYTAQKHDLESFSAQLGVTVEVLRNYLFQTPQGDLQLNAVLTETEEEAEGLYRRFLQLHPPQKLVLRGRRVLEMITDNLQLVETARSNLRFEVEAEAAVDATALMEYLEKYSRPAPDLAAVPGYIRAEAGSCRVFLVGESHGLAINQELESALLEFFVREGDVKHYLLELPPSAAGCLREYLESGDEELLHFVFSAHEGTYFATEESLRHWKRVHALYQSLPEEERFSLLGVDVEHYPVFALQYLHRLLMQLESDGWKNTKLADITAVLEGRRSIYADQALDFFEDLRAELESEAAEASLGTLTGEFDLVLAALQKAVSLPEPNGSLLWNAARDRAMYELFLKQADLNSGGKYFGQWGLSHVFQREQAGVQWFASLLNQTEGFAGSIFSLVLIYQDSAAMKNFSYEVLPFSNYRPSVNFLAELAAGSPLLVKLDGEDSPFRQELIWKLDGLQPAGGVTADYYQYILFVPGAEPAKPWLR